MSKHQEITGVQEDQWVLDVVSNVRNAHPGTDSDVLTTFEDLLQVKLSDRALTPAKLKRGSHRGYRRVRAQDDRIGNEE